MNMYNDMLLGLNVHVKSANSIMFFFLRAHPKKLFVKLNIISYLFVYFFHVLDISSSHQGSVSTQN